MKRGLGILCILLLFLTGCGVEPEKRAYPLALSVDLKDGIYEVRYGMARLSAVTGQGKEPESDSGESQAFRGTSLKEVRQAYDRSQQYYLDTGHVQAVLLGEALQEDREKLAGALKEMEENRMLGSGCYVFSSPDPGALMELDGTEVESLGEYLVGIYENRPSEQGEKGVTLQEVYSAWYGDGSLPALPRAFLGENGLPIVENP